MLIFVFRWLLVGGTKRGKNDFHREICNKVRGFCSRTIDLNYQRNEGIESLILSLSLFEKRYKS